MMVVQMVGKKVGRMVERKVGSMEGLKDVRMVAMLVILLGWMMAVVTVVQKDLWTDTQMVAMKVGLKELWMGVTMAEMKVGL